MKKIAALIFLLALPVHASAIQCGDTLANGDYTLTADVGPCSGTGPALTVSSAKLNLNGFAVRCQSAYSFNGTNLVFSQGVLLASSNSTLSNGSVVGCGNGVIAGGGGNHVVSSITTGGGWIGFMVNSDRNNVRYSTGRGPFAGFIVNGNRNDVHHNAASSASYGFSVYGQENKIYQNSAATSIGYLVSGSGHAISNNTASGLGSLTGFIIQNAASVEVKGNTATGLFRGFSVINSSGLDIDNNNASGNADVGIYVNGIADSQIRRNDAISNGLHGIVLYAGSATVSDNDASGNLFGDGIVVSSGFKDSLIKDNLVDNNGGSGIHLLMGVGGMTVQGNGGTGNGTYDFQDDNAGCGTNSWINNTGTGSQSCVQ